VSVLIYIQTNTKNNKNLLSSTKIKGQTYRYILKYLHTYIQGVFEMRVQILITSYWLHVELGKNVKKILSKNKMAFIC
jgi:hypothetical protein